MQNRKTILFIVSVILVLAMWGSSATASQPLDVITDPTCAVIEQADYDVETQTITIRGRSKTGFTLTVLDECGCDALVKALHPRGGKWTVEFDIVGSESSPGLVKVEGGGDCVATRKVDSGSLATLPLFSLESEDLIQD